MFLTFVFLPSFDWDESYNNNLCFFQALCIVFNVILT